MGLPHLAYESNRAVATNGLASIPVLMTVPCMVSPSFESRLPAMARRMATRVNELGREVGDWCIWV